MWSAKKTQPDKNMLIKMCGTTKQKGNSVIMFSTVEYVPPSWVPMQFFAKKGGH